VAAALGAVFAVLAVVLGGALGSAAAAAGPDPALGPSLVGELPGFAAPTDRTVDDLAAVYGGAAAQVTAGHIRTWARTAGPVEQTVLGVATRLRDEPSAAGYVEAFIGAARTAGGTDAPLVGLPEVRRVVWAGAGATRFDAVVVRRGDVVVSLSATPAGLFDDATLRGIAERQVAALRAALPGVPDGPVPERVVAEPTLVDRAVPILAVAAVVGALAAAVLVMRRRRAH
jgi:hypothetical protein